MQTENHITFKEWASVVNALANGRQILVLRKGGIREDGGEFQVEHNEFFLFPTYEHQNKADLKPEVRKDLDLVIQTKPIDPRKLPIQYYVQVVGVIQIKSESELIKIQPYHIWSDEAVKKRFEYGHEKGLFAIAVRVFRLPKPYNVEILPEYAGCKSWVGLKAKLSTGGAEPVLNDEEFQRKWHQISSLFSDRTQEDSFSQVIY